MSPSSFSNVPSWILQPSLLHNVLDNHFSPLKHVSSSISLSDSTSFMSGFRQALFWRRHLSPSTSQTTVIFSLLGPQGLIAPSVSAVCRALEGLCNVLLIKEIYQASNTHFLGITFASSVDAHTFRTSFTYFSNCIVVHVPLSAPLTHSFRLSWLPPVFPDHRIHHFLQKHSAHHSFQRDIISSGSDIFFPTNSVTGTLELSPDQDVNLIPHLIPLPPPHTGHALLIISGRPSLCLRCGLIGHIRRSCPAPRCTSCHYYHTSPTPCPTSDPVYKSPAFNAFPLDDFSNPDSSLDASISTSATPVTTFTVTSAPNPSFQVATPFECSHTVLEASAQTPPSTSSTQVLNKSTAKKSVMHPTAAKLPAFKTTTSKPKHSRKRAKTVSSKSSSSSSHSIDSSHTSPLSWADQMETETHDNSSSALPTSGMAPSPLSTTSQIDPVTTIPDPLDTSSHNIDSLLLLAAKLVHSLEPPLPPDAFLPTPHLVESIVTITCSHCHQYTTLSWPLDKYEDCSFCSRPLVILHHTHFIPDPAAHFSYLQLTADDHTDPSCIAYLLYCHRLKVPLIPIYLPSLPLCSS